MSMQVGPGSGEGEMVDINTTPLIDVMLVLLVMLIITLPIMTNAVKLDMPNPNQPPPPVHPQVVRLDIDFDGTIVWNGSVVPNMSTLEGYFRQEAVLKPQPEIHLSADPHVKYGVVAEVLAAAQRNHMEKIGFVNVPQFATTQLGQ